MKQLYMKRDNQPIRKRELPCGYYYEFFKGDKEEIKDWYSICRCGLLPEDNNPYFEQTILNYPDLNPYDDLFFVLDPEGKRVATSASVCHKNHEGYIHMVASLPECRGMGIGHAMLSHALEILRGRGCTFYTLSTDDFRLAAIKTYLDAGFLPDLILDSESDVKSRWDEVICNLGLSDVIYLEHVKNIDG